MTVRDFAPTRAQCGKYSIAALAEDSDRDRHQSMIGSTHPFTLLRLQAIRSVAGNRYSVLTCLLSHQCNFIEGLAC